MDERIDIAEVSIEVIESDGQTIDVEVLDIEGKIHPDEGEIIIFIDQKEYRVNTRELNGSELKKLGNIPESHLLFLEVRGPGDDELIQNNTVVNLRNGDCFYDMPQGNFGSH
ncbi:MAG: multiubiquitin domain-containing protein [Acidimicrobiales bacterium]